MGRCDELETWDDFQYVGPAWRDEVANVRLHAATHERPVDRSVEISYARCRRRLVRHDFSWHHR